MTAWSQILQIVGNSILIYLSFDIHDSPVSVFIVQIYYRIWKFGKIFSQISLCVKGFQLRSIQTWVAKLTFWNPSLKTHSIMAKFERKSYILLKV